MIIMAVFAILGAALGLFVRPRLLGVILAVLLAGAVEGGAYWATGVMEHQPNREVLILRVQQIFGDEIIDMIIPVAAAAIGAVLAAILGVFTDPKTSAPVLSAEGIQRRVGKDGRYARAEGMVQDRAIHAQAESRIDKILDL
ncbi:hypothetical protein [Caulobacter sp.]|jgi:hypothetical protein|uniref:hypothetical protein n=1 Tax=Caulobacter sp. TaxID=78 RepID=UPI0017D721FE